VAFGEIGLSGEVRRVSQSDLRLKEAAKLGFTQAIMPGVDAARKGNVEPAIRRVEIRRLSELLPLFEDSRPAKRRA